MLGIDWNKELYKKFNKLVSFIYKFINYKNLYLNMAIN